MPWVVRILAFLMVAQVLCGFWIVGISATFGLPAGALETPVSRIATLLAVWLVFCAVVLIRPLLMRSVSGWAAAQAVLACLAVADFAGLVILALGSGFPQRPPPPEAWQLAIRSTVELLLACFFFRAGGWFGVREGRGWRVVWNRGWWALVTTGGLALAYLVALAQVV